jgi:hypothetical protein
MLSDIRGNHSEAVHILHNERPIWVYIPIAQASPDLLLQRLFVKTITWEYPLVHFDADTQVTFYTDGGAIHPTDPDARLASWAVVSDVSCVSIQEIQNVSEYMGQSMLCPLLRVVGCGLVYGHQSAARGELIAFLKALVAAQKYEDNVEVSVVTDASYVCFIDFALRQQLQNFPDHRIKNADIIREIQNVWHPRIRVLKTKSHRSIDEAQDWHDLWTSYGNYAADFSATATLNNIPKSVRSLFDGIAAFRKSESARLEKVFRYLVDLNKTRIGLLQQAGSIVGQPIRPDVSPESSLMPSRAMGQDALDFLKEFAPSSYTIPLVSSLMRLTRRLLRVFCKAPITQLLWCRGLLRVDGPQMLPKITAAKTIGADLGMKCFSVSSCLVICTPRSKPVVKKLMQFFGTTMHRKPSCCQRPPVLPPGFTLHSNKPFWLSKRLP